MHRDSSAPLRGGRGYNPYTSTAAVDNAAEKCEERRAVVIQYAEIDRRVSALEEKVLPDMNKAWTLCRNASRRINVRNPSEGRVRKRTSERPSRTGKKKERKRREGWTPPPPPNPSNTRRTVWPFLRIDAFEEFAAVLNLWHVLGLAVRAVHRAVPVQGFCVLLEPHRDGRCAVMAVHFR
jgi:hypothetical protein